MRSILLSVLAWLSLIGAARAQWPLNPPVTTNVTIAPGFSATSNPPFQVNGAAAMTWSLMSNSQQAPVSAGTGYTTGDTVYLNDNCNPHAAVSVIATSGAITSATPIPGNAGICAVPPANPVGQESTSGGGQQATFLMSWGPTPGGQDLSGAISVVGAFATARIPLLVGATKFTATGCSVTTPVGASGTAGTFKSGTAGTCTVTLTLGGLTAKTGWYCSFADQTTPADKPQQTASTTTTVTMSGTTASADVISFGCQPF